MKCYRIKKLLSEYIDGTLDKKTATVVEKHLENCRNCRREYIFLHNLVEDLRSMERLEAPMDFVIKVRERIDTSSRAKKSPQHLFFPLPGWVPKGLIATAAAAALALIVFNNNVRYKSQIMEQPVTPVETAGLMGPGTGTDTIQLALSLATQQNPRALPSANVLLVASGNGAGRGNDIPELLFNNGQQEESSTAIKANPVSKMLETVSLAGGRLVSKEFKPGTDTLEYLTFEIPAVDYDPFIENIKEIGTLQTPAPALSKQHREPVLIRIRLDH
jgi:negative regulator of sigma E activity